MCRWLSEESLHIYARMNETTYSYWLSRAMTAPVDSVRATSLRARIPDGRRPYLLWDVTNGPRAEYAADAPLMWIAIRLPFGKRNCQC